MNPKENIRSLLATGEVLEGIAVWRGFLLPDDPLHRELIVFSGRWQEIRAEEARGLQTPEAARTLRNQMVNSLLFFLDRWEPGGNISPLRTALLRLRFDPDAAVGPLQLVNCDRQKPFKRFRRSFNRLKEERQAFQFYFIAGCRDEKPNSLAKRLIYELINEELDGLDGAIDYPFREATDCINIEPLPLGSDAACSRKKFKAYVAKRFRFADTQSFEAFIETGVPKLESTYVASVFDLSETAWEGDEGEIREYLQWMMDTFRCPHPDVPTFLFFFVVYSRQLHDEANRSARQREILAELEVLGARDAATLLTELSPVEPTHLEDWLYALGADDPARNQAVVQALLSVLTPDERRFFVEKQLIAMKNIEQVQREVFELLHR